MAFHEAEQHSTPAMAVTFDPSWQSLDELEEMQSLALRSIVDTCIERHPWYRASLAEAGIGPGDIKTLADLTRLPPTSKQTFIDHAESFRLEPDPVTPRDFILADVTYTAGTTSGVPTPIYQTSYDLRGLLFAQLRMANLRGLRQGDRVVNLYPLAPFPHGGWIRPTQAAATLGAPVVAATGGSAQGRFPVTRRFDEVVRLVVDTDPTVVWGIPSYVDRVLRSIAASGGQVPSLRMIAVSGEPCEDRRRESLVSLALTAGAQSPFVSDSLGASELQFSLVECPSGGGFHNPAPELAYIEVIGDDDLPVPDGEPGRLAYTHLDRRGTVLLRFLVGDRAVLDRSACPHCGWLGGRVVQHLGREGSLVKVRGNLVNINAAHESVASVSNVADHRIELRLQDGLDAMIVVIAPDPVDDEAALKDAVIEAVRATIGVRPEIQIASLEEIWSPDERMKPSRFVDLRKEGA